MSGQSARPCKHRARGVAPGRAVGRSALAPPGPILYKPRPWNPNPFVPESPASRPADPLAVLCEVFGYDAFRGEQAAIVHHVIGGGDGLVLMPTGGGKSLCYQIPALVRPGVGVVISPLIALDGRPGGGADPVGRPGRGAEFLAPVLRAAGGRAPDAATANSISSTSRRSGCWPMASSIGCSAATWRCSRSTRHIASASGATTSAPTIASSRCWRSGSRGCRGSH